MASRSRGKCTFCGGTFAKSAMANHLKSCKAREPAPELSAANRKRSPKQARIFHIVVEGRDRPMYWMHVEVPEDATLGKLDEFLRHIWLECCGHLSAFTIDEARYTSDRERDFGEKSMRAKLGDVLDLGTKFYHEYDFGTTTELTLRVVAERVGQTRGKEIGIMARNDPPAITCDTCEKPAAKICAECVWEDEGWLCDVCAEEHECGEEMLLPVVNSPRVGMCGYTGETY